MSKAIHSKAMLVDLTTRAWGGRITDYAVTAKALTDAGAREGSGSFIKALLPKEALRTIKSVQSKARQYHRENTLPWDDGGVRILSVSDYDAYTSTMDKFIDSMVVARRDLVDKYGEYVDEARQQLGQLFEPSDYPDVETIENAFDMEYQIMPIPSGQHIMFNIGKAETQKLQNRITDALQEKLSEANRDLYMRLDGAMDRIVDRMTETDDGESKIFCRSMIDQVGDLVEIVPRLNLTGDPALAKLCDQIKEKIASVDPDKLRPNSKAFDPKVRKQIKQDAKKARKDIGQHLAATN